MIVARKSDECKLVYLSDHFTITSLISFPSTEPQKTQTTKNTHTGQKLRMTTHLYVFAVVHTKNRSHEMRKRMVSEVTAHVPARISESETSSDLHDHKTESQIFRVTQAILTTALIAQHTLHKIFRHSNSPNPKPSTAAFTFHRNTSWVHKWLNPIPRCYHRAMLRIFPTVNTSTFIWLERSI